MIKLRKYQEDAINNTARDIARGVKKALIVAPTASGKSLICAGIAGRAVSKILNSRILVLCSQSEILRQNEQKLNMMYPDVSTGIYCAGAGRKETDKQVIFASRDSLGKHPEICGQFDGVLLDEAHQLAADIERSDTMYARILAAQTPKWVIGMSGTPWRLNGGRIWGEGKFFETITYNIPMAVLRKEGFLVPYIFPPTQTTISTDTCRTSSTGDFVIKDLEEVSATREVVSACIEEWIRLAPDRKCSLFFCVSRAHARLTHEILQQHLPKEQCAYIDGDVSDRDEMFERARAGKIRAIANVGVLTTGWDCPICDCIVFMRPTQSASLFIQMAGRGLRIHPESGKENCMILDFTDNFERFGSLEHPMAKLGGKRFFERKPPEEGEEQPEPEKRYRTCPACGYTQAGRTECPFCGEIFIKHGNSPFEGKKSETYVLSGEPYSEPYLTKKNEHCIRVTFPIGGKRVCEYYMVNRGEWIRRVYEKRMAQLEKGGCIAVHGRVSGGLIEVEKLIFSEDEIDNRKLSKHAPLIRRS